jgi:hypothetical protein
MRGQRVSAPCSIWDVNVGGRKIDSGERAVECLVLAVKLHRRLDPQFLPNEYSSSLRAGRWHTA